MLFTITLCFRTGGNPSYANVTVLCATKILAVGIEGERRSLLWSCPNHVCSITCWDMTSVRREYQKILLFTVRPANHKKKVFSSFQRKLIHLLDQVWITFLRRRISLKVGLEWKCVVWTVCNIDLFVFATPRFGGKRLTLRCVSCV